MTWFRPLIRPSLTNEKLIYSLIERGYEGVEFTPELIYLLVEGRLKRAYERNFT